MRRIRPLSLPVFRARLREIYTSAGKAPATYQQLDHALRLVERVGAQTTADLTTLTVARAVNARGPGANPITTRGILRRLRRACNVAVRDRLLDEPPDWPSLWPRCAARARSKAHTQEEVAAFLGHLLASRDQSWYAHRLCALGWLVALTGLRRHEALYARVEDVDLLRGWVFVHPRRRLKTLAAAAPVPLLDGLCPVLSTWIPHCGGSWLFPGARSGGPWIGGASGYRPKDRLQQAGAAVGIPNLGFQTLRHSLATHLLRSGVPVWAIQKVLRHTSPITTEHYLHPSDHDCARLVRGFAYGPAPSTEKSLSA